MQFRELEELVYSSGDAVFATDGAGRIVAWNVAAEQLFGLPAQQAVGQLCGEVLCGVDECGPVCAPECSVRQAIGQHQRIHNYDLHVQTPRGRQWCNISALTTKVALSHQPYPIHIVRSVDTRKRLELLLRDFVVNAAGLPQEQAKRLVTISRTPAREVKLTSRELEVLRQLAQGAKTAQVAKQLHISRATVNNHIQHILHKLNAQTRLEAIRRAEHAGLI
jgi:PAS domain S-box-containing protein